MVQKFTSVVLHFGILFVKILLKRTKFRQTPLLINAYALCPILLVSKSFVMPLRKYLFFVFLLQGVGKLQNSFAFIHAHFKFQVPQDLIFMSCDDTLQQAVMGHNFSYGVECDITYTWKESCIICHWKLSSFCWGSSKRMASPCWCMVLVSICSYAIQPSLQYNSSVKLDTFILFTSGWLYQALLFLQISFQPLVQCLDVDKLILLFTAVLLERRILLRSNKFVQSPLST